MFSTTGTTTGIDLGSKAVKLVRAQGKNLPEKLLNACIEDLTGAPENWAAEAEAALGRLMTAQRLNPRDLGRVITVVSGSTVHLRQVDLPRLEESELKASLKYEARKHLPIGKEEAAMDCQVLAATGEAQMSALMVGAPQALVSDRIRVLNNVGIEPEIVDAAPLALLNGVHTVLKPGDETTAILDLGASGTSIVLGRKGGAVYSRTVPIVVSTMDVVPALVRAYTETVQFFAPMNDRRGVDRVYLSGGNAGLKGLAAEIQKALSLSVSSLDLSGTLHYSPSRINGDSAEALKLKAPQLAVVLGLLYWGADGL